MPDHGEGHPSLENEIVVRGKKLDDGGFGGGGEFYNFGSDNFSFFSTNPFFDFFGDGGGGGAPAQPPAEEEEEEGPEIVVTAPSKGQEKFADDGDPFNDGERPTRQTVDAWIEELLRSGLALEVDVLADPSNPENFTGSYIDIGGNRVTFGSDGDNSYYLFRVENTTPDIAPPIDPRDIAFNDFYSGNYYLF